MQVQEFDYSVDLLRAILWQYDKAEHIKGLLESKSAWTEENFTQYWTDWYNNVFNLPTANTFGLAVWSKILNIPFFVPTGTDPAGKPIFGFNEVTTFPSYVNTYQNFENGNFSVLGGTIRLTEEEQRVVLRLRYFQLTSRGAIPEINTFLDGLFASAGPIYSGNAWVLDGLNMTMRVVFDFEIPSQMRTVLQRYDLIPRPAGVGIEYLELDSEVFGFGAENQNFENGNFFNGFF